MACSSCASDCRCAIVAGDDTINVVGTGSAASPYQISADICASLAAMTDNGREFNFATDKLPVINGSNTCELVSLTAGLDGPQGPAGPTGPAGGWSDAQTIVNHAGDYTLVTSDLGKFHTMTSEISVDLTIPSGLGWATGQRADVVQYDVGQVSFVASGTTLLATPGLALRDRYSSASILYMGSETYLIVGDLSA